MKRIAIVAALLLVAAVSLLTAQSMKKGFEWLTRQSDDPQLPGVNPLKVSGNIITAGSSTVYPLSERMVERFKDEGFGANITVDSIGSGAGFERFCVAGETDVSNASRAIKASEVEAAKKIGREPLELRIGTDALAVVLNKKNTFAKNVSKDELKLIFSTARKWSDVNPAWPAQDILRFIPGTDSGTFDYMVEFLFGAGKKEPILAAANLQLSEDDNVLVQGVEGSPYAVGFFGFAYYQENKDKLNVLSVGGVAPSAESVNQGTYPLARPLFLYSSARIMRDKPQVAAFLAFYLTYVNEEIRKVGYFPAEAAALKKSKQAWLDAMKGAY
jgi:phosphate transport system substrate-binding protein